MTYRDALDALAAALPALSERDANFAKSLLAQATSPYTDAVPLSQEQWKWVRKLAEKAAAPKPTKLDFSAVSAMFATAAAKSKRLPKVELQMDDGSPVVLKLAGPAAAQPGTVSVTDGKPFGVAVWYGRVNPVTGAWEPSSRVDATTTASVTALLTRFAADPLTVAKAYGEATHSCCFCGITLTDPRSKTAGYGPICAAKFGLAWGE
jgi:hypothetical protein